MVVALRALHGHAEEDLRRLGRRLHAALVHLVGQEIRRPVEVLVARPAAARGRDQLRASSSYGLLYCERLAADTAACPSRSTSDRRSVPPVRPMRRLVQIVVQFARVLVGVLLAQQPIDEPLPACRACDRLR